MAPWNFSWISQESFLTRSILWEDCLYIFVVKKNPTSVLALREACSRKACWRHPHFSCLKLALQHYRTVINKSNFFGEKPTWSIAWIPSLGINHTILSLYSGAEEIHFSRVIPGDQHHEKLNQDGCGKKIISLTWWWRWWKIEIGRTSLPHRACQQIHHRQ